MLASQSLLRQAAVPVLLFSKGQHATGQIHAQSDPANFSCNQNNPPRSEGYLPPALVGVPEGRRHLMRRLVQALVSQALLPAPPQLLQGHLCRAQKSLLCIASGALALQGENRATRPKSWVSAFCDRLVQALVGQALLPAPPQLLQGTCAGQMLGALQACQSTPPRMQCVRLMLVKSA